MAGVARPKVNKFVADIIARRAMLGVVTRVRVQLLSRTFPKVRSSYRIW